MKSLKFYAVSRGQDACALRASAVRRDMFVEPNASYGADNFENLNSTNMPRLTALGWLAQAASMCRRASCPAECASALFYLDGLIAKLRLSHSVQQVAGRNRLAACSTRIAK